MEARNARTTTRAGGGEGDNRSETASTGVRAEAKIQIGRKNKNDRRYVKTIGMVHTCCIKTTINYVRAQLILLLMLFIEAIVAVVDDDDDDVDINGVDRAHVSQCGHCRH
jgi:chromate transport protein ChrA